MAGYTGPQVWSLVAALTTPSLGTGSASSAGRSEGPSEFAKPVFTARPVVVDLYEAADERALAMHAAAVGLGSGEEYKRVAAGLQEALLVAYLQKVEVVFPVSVLAGWALYGVKFELVRTAEVFDGRWLVAGFLDPATDSAPGVEPVAVATRCLEMQAVALEAMEAPRRARPGLIEPGGAGTLEWEPYEFPEVGLSVALALTCVLPNDGLLVVRGRYALDPPTGGSGEPLLASELAMLVGGGEFDGRAVFCLHGEALKRAITALEHHIGRQAVYKLAAIAKTR